MAFEINDKDFEQEVLASETPVLVDFWAEWCGPCNQIAPILEELSKDKAGQLKIVKVNIDHNPDSPAKYGVRGIPTLMIFKGGKHLSTKVGAVPKSGLYEWIDSVVK
jgi:thioredoxin 1